MLTDMLEHVSLARRGVIRPIISDRFNRSQATEALTNLKAGKIIGRGVINPSKQVGKYSEVVVCAHNESTNATNSEV